MRPHPPRHVVAIAVTMLAASFNLGCARPSATLASSSPATPTLPSPLALACLSCHSGPDRQRHATDLSSLSAQDIRQALHEWRDGQRQGTVMPRLARALGDGEIEQLAHELGARP